MTSFNHLNFNTLGMAQAGYYNNAGRMTQKDKIQYSEKSSVRPMVMRGGVMIDIKEHNAKLFASRREVYKG